MFDFSNETEKKSYLRTAGLHKGGIFKSLTYNAEPSYEYFDIVLEVDGAEFRDRTFGTTVEKVFTRKVFEKGVPRDETKEEAFEREYKEKFFKVLYLVMCFTSEDAAKEAIGKFDGLKDLVEKANAIIAGNEAHVNFLTIWRNSDSKQESRLVIADRVKWIEPVVTDAEGNPKEATLSLTKYQKDNMLVEKYPYNGGGSDNESSNTSDTLIDEEVEDDLPF